MKQELIIRGRLVTASDLSFIHFLVKKHWHKGRTFISQELCRHWNWVQQNDSLKDMACRELLRRLEAKGYLQLPPRKNCSRNHGRNRKPIPVPEHDSTPIEKNLKQISPIRITMVRGSELEPLFNGLIEAYHYLGYCQIVGAHLKYIAFAQEKPLAGLSFGSASWKVSCRDQFIGWSPEVRTKNLPLIINNTRFLILPWVKVPYLASHLLSLLARILPSDWQRVYGYSPVLLETFVDKQRFVGTCYKAANWIEVGTTSGRGKYDRYNQKNIPIKTVFIYPLNRYFRETLNQ